MKTQDVTCEADAQKKISDIKVVGRTDTFQLLCKASSDQQGWMKSTKAMHVPGGCVVQVSTQQKGLDGTYAVAEALAFVPGAVIAPDDNGGRKLVSPVDVMPRLSNDGDWHELSSVREGGQLTELLAACSADGIGVIARWMLRENGGWDVTAMDTEGAGGMQPVTDFHEGESVPPAPPLR